MRLLHHGPASIPAPAACSHFQCAYCLIESVHVFPLVLILAAGGLRSREEESAILDVFRDRAYHLGMIRIDSNPVDRMGHADALFRGVPEEEEDEEEEEQGENEEEGEDDEDEGEGYSE